MRRFLLLGLGLLLTACPGPPPPEAFNPKLVQGEIGGTPYALGSVRLALSDESANTRPTVKVAENNRLTFDLGALTPPAAELSTDWKDGCAPAPTQATRLSPRATFLVYGSEGDLLGSVLEEAVSGSGVAPGTEVLRLYADSALNVEAVCGNGVQTLKLQLQPGWNALLLELSADGKTQTVRSAPNDLKTQLKLDAYNPRVSVLLPKELRFTSSAKVTVPVTFVQVGGYAGPVRLSTDLPGLSVEPSTVTLPELPRLSAQAGEGGTLRQQVHEVELTFSYTGPETQLDLPFNLLVRAESGQAVGSGPSRVIVQRASAFVQVPGGQVQVSQGQSVSVPVRVTANGFQGNLQLALSGLPEGVSAQVPPLTVGAGAGEQTVSVTLTAAPGAALGTFQVKVSSPQAVGTSEFTLSVFKKAIPLDTAAGPRPVRQLLRAPEGVWGMKEDAFFAVRGEQVTLYPAARPAAIAVGPDGTLWGRNRSSVYRVQGGALQAFPDTASPDFEPLGLAADAQGRVWFTSLRMMSGKPLELRALNPKTGQLELTVPTTLNQEVRLYGDPAGQNIFFYGQSGDLYKLDPATGQLQSAQGLWSTVFDPEPRLSFDRQGRLWLVGNEPGVRELRRIDPATLTIAERVNLPSEVRLPIIEDANTVWSLTDAGVTRFSLPGGTRTDFALPGNSNTVLSLAPGAGVAAASDEITPTGAQQSTLRFFP